ncbi:MAG: ElyC/SanA/YdcF family protein, partial [Candidatus Omnitrophota bacterium]|nr:ElyC/SanA/YdcF family protein [Candidatus Omnitrophota bacterium]
DYVQEVHRLATSKGWDSILLVTSPYHTRRAHLTFARNAPELEVFQAPISESNFYARRNGISVRQLRGILHEWMALIYYRLRGWI